MIKNISYPLISYDTNKIFTQGNKIIIILQFTMVITPIHKNNLLKWKLKVTCVRIRVEDQEGPAVQSVAKCCVSFIQGVNEALPPPPQLTW